MTTRRLFLRSALGFLAAPAIVRVGSLMPVKAIPALPRVISITEGGGLSFIVNGFDMYGKPTSEVVWYSLMDRHVQTTIRTITGITAL